MKNLILTLALILSANLLQAQPAGFWGPCSETVEVWPDGAPNAFTYDAATDPQGENYKDAVLEIYPARNPNGYCILLCPGGGYAVLSMERPYTHEGSRFGLLGAEPSEELVQLYCNHKQVTSETPAAFIIAATDDFLVPVKNSLLYYEALVENKVSATMHIYPTGGHGFGWGDGYIYKSEWAAELERWLNTVVISR